MRLEIDKETLLVMQLFKARNEVRYYLNGIFFGADGKVCATNGHTMAVGNHDNKIDADILIEVNDKPKVTRFDKAIIDTETLIVEYLSEAGTRIALGICSIVDGRFPDYKRVIPKSFSACDEIGFNAGYLAMVEKAAKLFNPKWQGVRLSLNGNVNGALATITSPGGKSCQIIVMPMRI